MRKVDPEKARRLWDYGLSTAQIAERIGCSKGTVNAALRKLGVNLKAACRHGYAPSGGGARYQSFSKDAQR